MRSLAISLAVLLTLYACRTQPETPRSYFDSLVWAQHAHHGSHPVYLLKETRVNEVRDSTSELLTEAAWRQQLDVLQSFSVFRQPGVRDQLIRTDQPDTESNLMIRSLRGTDGGPDIQLDFYYLGNLRHLYRIRGRMREQNLFFRAHRQIDLQFAHTQGVSVLTQYEISGVQQMLWSDSIQFSLKGHVYPGVPQ